MPVDPSAIGKQLGAVSTTVEAGRLRLFAKAIGDTNPVFTDTDAAASAGYRDLPVPPTFLFGIEMESPDPFAWLSDLGVDLRRVLHASQSFTYLKQAFAGDVLTVAPRIVDVYSKKGGALEFVEKATTVVRDNGDLIAELKSVLVVRHPAPTTKDSVNTEAAK